MRKGAETMHTTPQDGAKEPDGMPLHDQQLHESRVEILMQHAAELCKREHDEETEELGLLPPSRSIDPLNPPLSMYSPIPLRPLFPAIHTSV
jgi:hypothetical protein